MAELTDLDSLDFFEEDDEAQLQNTQNDPQRDDNTKEDDSQDDNSSGYNEPDNDNDDEDVLTLYLRSKGIDANSVKMENEDGETEGVSFNDLTKEEQLQLLNYNPAEQEEPELADDEARLLGILRQNNMSVQDYLNAYRRHVIEQYDAVQQQQMPEQFSVDDYSDEELFIADLKDKVPDLTEDDAMKALEAEAQNPELFQKKVAGLRTDYENRERAVREQEAYQQQQAQAQQAAQFESIIVDTIQKNHGIDLGDTSLELSADDMNEIASFILDSDAAGVRHIAKALNDPRTLVEMAWWALKGHDALNQVTQYYKKQIADARRSARTSGPTSRTKPTTVVTRSNRKPNGSGSKNGPIQDESDLYDNLI